MNSTNQFRAGIRKAIEITGTSPRQASLKAGFNENQLHRFLTAQTDIKLTTLEKICMDGFGMKFQTIYDLGKEK